MKVLILWILRTSRRVRRNISTLSSWYVANGLSLHKLQLKAGVPALLCQIDTTYVI